MATSRDGIGAPRQGADTLHAVYSALLDRLTLSATHRAALQARGLAEDGIDRAGYRTLPVQGRPRIARDLRERFGDAVLGVPGFVAKDGDRGPYLTLRGPAGLIVPCRDRAGRIVALKVRRDDAGAGRGRTCYVSSAGHGGPGCGAPVHCPAGTPETAELVRLTEGELTADVVQALTGVPTISAPGVGSWRPALAVLKELGCRTVRLAFDADAWASATVAPALSRCADALAVDGFAVELERWPADAGKGLDDLLATGQTPDVLAGDTAMSLIGDMLGAATAGAALPPCDELTRLYDVLRAGGAEALFRDRPLLQALADLAGADPAGYAAARASIRERVPLRELDRALRSYRRPADDMDAPTYFDADGCTYRRASTKDGDISVPLCNFVARIVEDVEHDDGAERARYLAIEGTLAGGSALPRVEVSAADYARMEWVVSAWGTRAVVHAGMGTRDHLRAALQLLSGAVPQRTVYGHVGWRLVGDAWCYLHAGGAIGAAGLVSDIPMSLPDALTGYELPAPPDGAALAAAIRASLGLLRLGPDRLVYPLLAAVYRAALGDTDFALHLAGPTGAFKTAAAALAQQHYGAGMDARRLPASWSSTGNALEGLAFAAKDALLCVDDFCPCGSVGDVQRYHREADRLLRGQGNRAGRLRMRADASLRPARPPRGLVLSTGEDTPRGQSLRARLLVLEVSPGDFGPAPGAAHADLSACQRDADAGLYAAALSGYLRWLAPQLDAVRGRLRGDMDALRAEARGDGQHARTPGIVADLALGLRYLLDFALAAGAITHDERGALWRRGWAALGEAAAAQAAHHATAEPAALFVRLVLAAVASGHAHIADAHGDPPGDPMRFGWRPEVYAVGGGQQGTRYRPQGTRAGWLSEGELYLEPDGAYAVAQGMAVAQGESFAVGAHTLRRRLHEQGLLASVDDARGRLTVRRTLQGDRREVLHIARQGRPSVPDGPSGPKAWAGIRDGGAVAADEPAQPASAAGTNGHALTTTGPEMGRLGRSAAGREGAAAAETDKQSAGDWEGWR